ncbi:hypothetical protein [Streptomyces sp. NPDC006638]|uniref:DUF6197 family protein n=1 Tax=Streptomyces sp. NPDC006638 TaxID=3157183 RepID=UPI00339F990C
MTMLTTGRASRPPAGSRIDVDGLIADFERYLAAQARPVTAHPLLSKTTAELVAEALGTVQAPAAGSAPVLKLPGAWVSRLPRWAQGSLKSVYGGGRSISASDCLDLAALVVDRAWTQGDLRGRRGAVCIDGALSFLLSTGYGDIHTGRQAAAFLQSTLGDQAGAYTVWNDRPGRTRAEVVRLIRTAAARAREAGR